MTYEDYQNTVVDMSISDYPQLNFGAIQRKNKSCDVCKNYKSELCERCEFTETKVYFEELIK